MRILISALLLILLAAPVFADPVSDRLTALETIVQSLQTDSVSRNEKVASALSIIEQIKLDYQEIMGTLEADDHVLKQQQAEIFRLKRDMEDRLAALEERLQIYDQQITKAVAKVLPQLANETENYQKGLDFVQGNDFLTAVSAFRTFVKAYPKSELADNAQYWIGECYYALKDFSKGIKEFQTLVEKYPKSDKAGPSILKQGLSFAELGMAEEAKTFLNKVIKDFPGSDEAVRAREKLDKLEQKSQSQQPDLLTAPVPLPDLTIPLAPGVKYQPATEAPPRPTAKERE